MLYTQHLIKMIQFCPHDFMAELEIACLGEFQVTLAGAVLTLFQTDKNRALLLYLALETRIHQRAELAQFLWPGYSDESARNSLRQSLHQLRQTLADPADTPWLLLTRRTVQINPDAPIGVDVLTFRHLLATCARHAHWDLTTCAPCLARLRQAVALYRGDFLAGFTVADSAPFEEWRRITQEQLHVQMLDALTQLAAAAAAAGDDAQALDAARRLLTLEPWLEEAHRQVMRLLARQGQRAAALAQYQHCRQVLAAELGAAPDAETSALYEQIRSGQFGGARRPDDKVTRDKVTSHPGAGAHGARSVTESPSHPVSPSPPHNLPGALTPLVGRAQALAEITAHLQRSEVRLLTLVGPGGMGKTRLAIEVGHDRLATFADGVFFVPLAPITTPDALAPAIANALGIALQGSDPRTALLQSLRSKQLLLILDNFEQLLVAGSEAVDLVVELLGAALGVQIIVTARERLKLRNEQAYPVQALDFSVTATLAEATTSAAVRLFVQSVQRVQTDFHLTATNLAPVLRICQLVQGMPLGLELAAANAVGVPLRAIADAIEQSLEFLAVDWRDVPERQRSMRAIFTWSWQLLSPAEQRILRQSAVFRGGFTYAAAQTVTEATLPLLGRLVDKSLFQWQTTATGEGRYVLHELLRQFAEEELKASGERAEVEKQHGRYYLAYLAARGLRLGRHEPKEASTEIQAELDNIRQAWQWATKQGRVAELDQATYAWWQFCQFQGLEAEGRQSFAVAIAGVRHQATSTTADAEHAALGQRLLAKLLAIHADYLFAQGRNEEMEAQAREAIRLGAASGGVEGETYGTFVLGRVVQEFEQYQSAGDLWRQTLQLIRTYQPSHADSELLYELNWMAYVWLRGDALRFGNYVSGRAYMVQALQLAQALGKRRCELHSLSALARTDFYQGDFAAAESGFTAALALARALGYRPVEMGAQGGLGDLLRLRGDYTTACSLLEQAVATAADLALPYDESILLASLIRLYCQLGNQATATQRYEHLVQLLAHVKLPKECQLAGWLVAALMAHYAGKNQPALHYAEQANQLTEQGDILFRLVDASLILGHARAAVGQWQGATTAFQEALVAFTKLGKQALAAEPQAGLAQIALAQGDLAGALAQVKAFLPALAEQPHAGYNNPFFIYLTGYRVLAATGDTRAAALLQQGYDLLQQVAAPLDNETRQRFLTAVPIHRDLVTAYREAQPAYKRTALIPEPQS